MSQTAPSSAAVVIRRLVVLVIALFLMTALGALGVTGRSDGPDPTIVAAIGFVVLAAFMVGEGTKALLMPSVTGYIATGLVLGPGITGFFGKPLVEDMTIFNSMALALIALSAGLELHASSVKRIARTLLTTIALKLPLLAIFVAGSLYGAFLLGWLPAVTLPIHAVLLAIVFALLSIATSSAVPIAVIAEHRSKGRYTDLVMMMPVVKDVVVVLLLAAFIPIAQSTTSGGALDLELLQHLLMEIGLTVVVGAAVGVCLILYVRWVHREMLVFTVAMVLGVSELSRALQLELLLLFITAGVVVRNFSDHHHDLIVPIRRVALPVFVIFFTTAGANIDVDGTLAVLPLAATISLGRALAYFLANRTGARLGGESITVQRWGWLGYLPQSAVNIGLTLLAARGIPALKDPILSIGFATIALHLLVGPILLGIALRKSGESALSPKGHLDPRVPPPPFTDPDGTLPPDKDVSALIARLRALVEAFAANERGRIAAESAIARTLGPAGSGVEAPEATWTEVRRVVDDDWPARVGAIHKSLVFEVQCAPVEVVRPFDPELRRFAQRDSAITRIRKALSVVAAPFSRRRTRQVPFQAVVRVAFEPLLAAAALELLRDRFRYRARLLAAVRRAVEGSLTPADLAIHLSADAAVAEQSIARVLEAAVDRGEARASEFIAIVDGPALPRGFLRYSRVEQRVTSALALREAEGLRWSVLIRAALDAGAGTVKLAAIRTQVRDATTQHAVEPLKLVATEIGRTVEATLAVLADASALIAAGPRDDALVERLSGVVGEAFPAESNAALRRIRARFRRAVQLPNLRAVLLQAIAAAPERLQLIASDTPIEDASSPEAVGLATVDLRARLEAIIVDELTRAVAEALTPVQRSVSALPIRLKQAVAVAVYTLELGRQGRFEDDLGRFEAIGKALERARAEALEALAETVTVVRTATDAIEEACSATREQVGLELRPERSRRRARFLAALDAIRSGGGQLANGVTQTIRAISGLVQHAGQEFLHSPAVRDRRLRSGREVLDSAGIRLYVEERLPLPGHRAPPPILLRAFSLDALTDRREAVVYREELGLVVADLAAPDWREARSVLVLGRRGSGRTTLVNMAQLRLGGGRVVRLDETLASRQKGIVSALAQELGCPEEPRAIAESARLAQAVILVDGLEQWLLPTAESARDLESFLLVVTLAGADVRWLVTMNSTAFVTFEEVMAIRGAFRRVIHLDGLGWEAIGRVIAVRERLTGHRFDYDARGPIAGWVPFVGKSTERHFRGLRARTGGVLRPALAAHVAQLQSQDERTFSVVLGPPPALPFVAALEPDTKAALSVLARFGALEADSLATALGLTIERTLAILHELGLVGFLDLQSAGTLRFRLAPHLESAVESELLELGQLALPKPSATPSNGARSA